MYEVVNRTPFVVALVPGLDATDVAHVTVLAKGTFSLPPRPGPLVPAEQQVPALWADEHNGDDPATSSVRYESDAAARKPGTDVVLVGHAHAGARRQPTVDVGLKIGTVRKVVRVTGERRWVRTLGTWSISSPPVPFERMPLVYERAFGGFDKSDANPGKHAGDDRNPVGAGFAATDSKARLEGLPLPNLEDPRQPIKSWKDRPPVAGFGFVARSWLPRRLLAGSYDEAWLKTRSPLLPADFDERFFNGAPADQVVAPHLRGGEPVLISGVSADGPLTFELPRARPDFEVRWADGAHPEPVAAVLDTVLFEPDERRVVLSWRSTVRCGRRLRQLRQVVVRMGAV
jgi:hypothetical protein